MLLITRMLEHYFSLLYEDFTSKIIVALTIPELIEGFDKDDFDRLKFIEENTCEKAMVSIYKLDRAVNPSRGEFKSVLNKRKFIRNDFKVREARQQPIHIELDEDQMQHFLCCAVREINQIIFKNVKMYDEDFALPQEDKEDDTNYDEFGIKKISKTK